MEKKNYNIYAGLGGSFGENQYIGTVKDYTESEAEAEAYDQACEVYESYEGSHGLPSYRDIMEDMGYQEDDLNNEDIQEEISEAYYDERESWLDYKAVPVDEDTEFSNYGEEIVYLN